LKLAAHPQVSEQRERLKELSFREPQEDEQQLVEMREAWLPGLAAARDATPGALQGVCLSVGRAQAQNVPGLLGWARASV
jgi:hypothetical protein